MRCGLSARPPVRLSARSPVCPSARPLVRPRAARARAPPAPARRPRPLVDPPDLATVRSVRRRPRRSRSRSRHPRGRSRAAMAPIGATLYFRARGFSTRLWCYPTSPFPQLCFFQATSIASFPRLFTEPCAASVITISLYYLSRLLGLLLLPHPDPEGWPTNVDFWKVLQVLPIQNLWGI